MSSDKKIEDKLDLLQLQHHKPSRNIKESGLTLTYTQDLTLKENLKPEMTTLYENTFIEKSFKAAEDEDHQIQGLRERARELQSAVV